MDTPTPARVRLNTASETNHLSDELARERRDYESAFKLCAMFGVFYFVQGINEPTEGLIAQPVRSLLKSWGRDAGDMATFSLLLAAPWYCKPLFGCLTDFIPIAGYRRKAYLLLTTLVTAVSLIAFYFVELPYDGVTLLLTLLLLPTIGVAFGDVVVDGLMVDKGQPRGLTGKLQSVQWGCIWTGSILAAAIGGLLSEHKLQQSGLLICGCITLVSFLTTAFVVREPRDTTLRPDFRQALHELRLAASSKAILPVAVFLFLWNFNPFATHVQYVFMTRDFGISEEHYGYMQSFGSVSAMLASFAYGFYCRRVPRRWLVHFSIAGGVLATVCYWGLHDRTSATMVVIFSYAANATATMVQLDFSAQCVPPAVAGTAFALLMSLSNLGTQLSATLGGHLYEYGKEEWGHVPAFHALVAVGAATTACCWLLTPVLARPAAPPSVENAPAEP